MSKYFVAKSANGELVGELSTEEIVKKYESGLLPGLYVATKVHGLSYEQLVEDGNAAWVTIADLVSHAKATGQTSEEQASRRSKNVLRRYQASYRVAETLMVLGNSVKIIAILIALLATIICIAVGVSGGPGGGVIFAFFAVIYGLVIALVFYIFGSLIGSVGHFLRLRVDSTVCGNPFLTGEDQYELVSFMKIEK